jgi:hypothetical protein
MDYFIQIDIMSKVKSIRLHHTDWYCDVKSQVSQLHRIV